ncbi:MAG: hypothetical protein JO110_28600 [Acetobacteraceae bacterium]|nr:hypothetical protein [Acetobacteraceae bacterium]
MTNLSRDLSGRVERLSPTAANGLMLLFEAVSNALSAAHYRFGPETDARAVIIREVPRADPAEEQSPVTGFGLKDTGIGLRTSVPSAVSTAGTRLDAAARASAKLRQRLR